MKKLTKNKNFTKFLSLLFILQIIVIIGIMLNIGIAQAEKNKKGAANSTKSLWIDNYADTGKLVYQKVM